MSPGSQLVWARGRITMWPSHDSVNMRREERPVRMSCMSYFMCCCGKLIGRSNLREEGFLFEDTSMSSWQGKHGVKKHEAWGPFVSQ